QTPSRMTIGGDRVVFDGLISALQRLESHVSYMTVHALRSVRWDRPTEVWQAETPEEELLIQVNHVRLEEYDETHRARVAPEILAGMTERAEVLNELTVLKALWREGANEFLARRYIQAFYDFYFILEGRYAKGRSSESQV